jgi:hypothetical protein
MTLSPKRGSGRASVPIQVDAYSLLREVDLLIVATSLKVLINSRIFSQVGLLATWPLHMIDPKIEERFRTVLPSELS